MILSLLRQSFPCAPALSLQDQSADWSWQSVPLPPSVREVSNPSVLTEGEQKGRRADVGIRPYTRSTGGVCVYVTGRTGSSAPTHVYRTSAPSVSCHCEERSDVAIRFLFLFSFAVERKEAAGGMKVTRRRQKKKVTRAGARNTPFLREIKEGPPCGGPSFMFFQRFSTSRTPRQYPYRRRCTGWPGPSWPRAASASRAAGSR